MYIYCAVSLWGGKVSQFLRNIHKRQPIARPLGVIDVNAVVVIVSVIIIVICIVG